MEIIYLVSLICSLYLTGVIWTIQLVHYPSFAYVSLDRFKAFNQFHQKAMTILVGPVMIIELVFAGLFALISDKVYLSSGTFAIVVVIWFLTFFVSVPLHDKLLNNGYDKVTIAQLIRTNWPRTILWSIKTLLLLTEFWKVKII